MLLIPYSGKLSKEKTNLEVLGLLAKVFGGVAFVGGTSEQSAKVFSAKILFLPICESLLPQKFSATLMLLLIAHTKFSDQRHYR